MKHQASGTAASASNRLLMPTVTAYALNQPSIPGFVRVAIQKRPLDCFRNPSLAKSPERFQPEIRLKQGDDLILASSNVADKTRPFAFSASSLT